MRRLSISPCHCSARAVTVSSEAGVLLVVQENERRDYKYWVSGVPRQAQLCICICSEY